MKIKWYGHAAFKLTTDEGVRVIIDPYQPGAFGGALSYGRITEEADIVLASHDHDDHNYTKDIRGDYKVFNREGVYREKNLIIEAFSCYHDPSFGKERGNNLIFVVDTEGLRVAHLGDLGHLLTSDTMRRLGRIDVVLLPVGGFYTIDGGEAWRVLEDIKPRIAIPMHYKTPKCDFPISGVEAFSGEKKGVRRIDSTEIEISKDSLPREREIIIMEYAL